MRSQLITLCALFLIFTIAFGSPLDLEAREAKEKSKAKTLKAKKAGKKQATYAIAHMVLDKKGLKDAVDHGANAVEIDIAAFKEGWWADHDTKGKSWGDKLEDLLGEIAKKYTKQIAFVWLDFKASGGNGVVDTNKCKAKEKCSVESLHKIVQKTLGKAGVNTLYGFFQDKSVKGHTMKYFSKNLKAGEAIVLSGEEDKVLKTFGKSVPAGKRVLDYGYTELSKGFGSLKCNEKDYKTCAGLRNASKARDKGKLKRVFGWTANHSDGQFVNAMLDKAKVDGIIYGFQKTRYYDHKESKQAAKNILDNVKRSKNRYMATWKDKPW
ncbi:hypothetical protein AJ79_00720 [Helicocarpus griseus UAMH5409]|uniref:Phospholipase D n=1 Tax=Helicocarpus griseus UAMH5409 TaxID=1447875 RepID=A0A2B7YB44_9EURO|nr:hypothetical protein AJ79_00720 [Helicocarpus griseus UAMH5409]